MNKIELLLCAMLVIMLALTFNQSIRLSSIERRLNEVEQSQDSIGEEWDVLVDYFERKGLFLNGN